MLQCWRGCGDSRSCWSRKLKTQKLFVSSQCPSQMGKKGSVGYQSSSVSAYADYVHGESAQKLYFETTDCLLCDDRPSSTVSLCYVVKPSPKVIYSYHELLALCQPGNHGWEQKRGLLVVLGVLKRVLKSSNKVRILICRDAKGCCSYDLRTSVFSSIFWYRAEFVTCDILTFRASTLAFREAISFV